MIEKKEDLMLDVSQAHELKMAFRRNGWSKKDIKELSQGKKLGDVLDFIKNQTEVRQEMTDLNVLSKKLIREEINMKIVQKWMKSHLKTNNYYQIIHL